MTFTIIARDAGAGEMGIASQSHFFAVGSLVGRSLPGVGVIASQAFADPSYIARGFAALEEEGDPEGVLRALVAEDSAADIRQVGIMSADHGSAVYTGERCVVPAGGFAEDDLICMGNMLAAPVWEAMRDAYRTSTGPLAERLVAALHAGQSAGGDIRGKQSAMLVVTRIAASAAPWTDVLVDLRVDDHPTPIDELSRLVELQLGYRSLGEALFSPSLVAGTADDSEALERAEAALSRADEILSPNLEPLVWRAVIRARAGKLDEARADANAAIASHPPYRSFLQNLHASGFLSAGALSALVD